MKFKNNTAYKEFDFEDEYEAGVELKGTEVKSLRQGRGSVDGAYAKVDENGEVWMFGVTIPRYDHASTRQNHDPERPRKLLLHKNQIHRIMGKAERKNYTIAVKGLYFRNGHVKVEIAVARRRERKDRRDDIRKREAEQQMREAERK